MASGFMRKTMIFLGLDDDELDDYDPAYEPEAVVGAQVGSRRYQSDQSEPVSTMDQPKGIRPLPRESLQDPSGPVSVPRPRPVVAMPGAKVHVVSPERFADAQDIGDHFRGGQPVVLNLQSADDPGLRRRMIDFCSGLTYALYGRIEKIAEQVFLLSPHNVEVSADEKRRLGEQATYRP
jgi:cell division inhibitor SepF